MGTALLPKPGDIIAGKYSLERIIGQGGMGAVFAARHVKLGHAVAIKVMLADRQNEEAARRFMNEGRASANIQNDHVVRIFDIDEEHGYAYMVLELLQGEDLAQVLEEQGRLAPHVAVGYVLQALEGVRQAHALGIVHRDLKPSNLFLARLQSGNVVVKVLDFGISKAGGSALDLAPHQQTSTAAMLGSPLYMSPEQLRSSKNVDARADIWAMGVILYELLTGTVPFDGDTLGALFAAILESDAPRVSAKASVPPGLDAIVARCLQRRPEDRYASAADLERELTPFASAQAAASYPLMMTAAMPPPTPGAVPPGARGSMGTSGQGAPMAMSSPAAATGYAPGAQSSAHLSQQQVVAPGTVPLGAITPQPYQQTGNTWQRTGADARPAKGSSAGLVAGMVIGAVVLAAAGLIGVKAFTHRGAAAGSEVSASASASAASAPSANVAAGMGMPSSADSGSSGAASAASASSAPSSAPATPATAAAASAATAHGTTTPGTKHPSAPAVAKVDPKPAETAKVDPPPPAPPPPRPPPASTPTGGMLQNGR
jgi:serine/threonine-protein kinase